MFDVNHFLNKIADITLLDSEKIESLTSKVSTIQYRKNQIINNARSVFFVSRGVVRISKITSTGDLVFKNFATSGDIFGGLFMTEFSEQAIAASDEVGVYKIQSNDVLKSLREYTMVTSYIARLEEGVQQTEEYYISLMTTEIRDRLIIFLEKLIRTIGRKQGGKIIVDNLLSNEDIANCIFATRQSVSVHMNELQKSGWFQKVKKELIFCRPVYKDSVFATIL